MEIRQYRSTDRRAAVALYRRLWKQRSGSALGKNLRFFKRTLVPDTTLVTLDTRLIGYSVAVPFEYVRRELYRMDYLFRAVREGDEQALSFWQCGRPYSVHDTVIEDQLGPSDILFTEIGVHADWSGRGVGSAMLERSIDAVRPETRYQIVTCWGGSYSVPLFTKFGFRPTITCGGFYSNGDTTTVMVRTVEQK